MIQLKNGEVINTEIKVDDLAEILNKQEFVVIWGKWFNKYEVKYFESYNPKDIDYFVLSQTKDNREILEKEIVRRKKEWLRINIEILNNVLDKKNPCNS